MEVHIREIRGIPKFLLKEYLIEMGGKILSEDLIVSDYFQSNLKEWSHFDLEPLRLDNIVSSLRSSLSAKMSFLRFLE